MKDNRVVIAVPSGDSWDAKFAMCMIFMSCYIGKHYKINGLPTAFRVHNKKGSILCALRQMLVETALMGEATHLLFIDTNIATKTFPSSSTARKKGKDIRGVPVYTNEDSTGLEEVWMVGTGIMLIDLKIFKRENMRKAPWFTMEWNEEVGHYMGEDWFFCNCLHEAGVPIFIDHDLSKEVGHMGKLEYTVDMVEQVEEEPNVRIVNNVTGSRS
jgi:hypothetical protein